MHETFERVARHVHKAPPGVEALGWVYRIATNYCLNQLRNRKNALQPLADLAALTSTRYLDQETALVDQDLARRVLASVPESTRVVAVLRHVDGLHTHEVAGALGVSRRTVVYRLAEFRKNADRFMRTGP